MKTALLAVGLVAVAVFVVFGTKHQGSIAGLPASPVTAATASPAPDPSTQNEWVIRTQTSQIDDVTTTFVDSDGGTKLGGIVLCFQNKGKCHVPVYYSMPGDCFVESNVDGEYSSYERRIRYRFDGDKPRTAIWSIADDHSAIIPPNSKAFIEEIEHHKNMVLEAGCASYDRGELTANLIGLLDTLNQAHLK